MQRQSTAEHSSLLCGRCGIWYIFKAVHLLAISDALTSHLASKNRVRLFRPVPSSL